MPLNYGQNNSQNFLFGTSPVLRIYKQNSLVFLAGVPAPSIATYYVTAGPNRVSFPWYAPANTNLAAITGYVVQYSSNNGTTWTTANDINLLTGTTSPTSEPIANTTVSGLTNGVTYSFRVAAVTSQGVGNYSNVFTATPTALPAAPNVAYLDVGDTYVLFAYYAQTMHQDASPITSYSLQYSSNGGTTWTTYNRASTDRSMAIRGLTTGTAYYVRIAAVNSAGTGPYTTYGPVTPSRQQGVPGVPTNVTTTSGNGSVTVHWEPPVPAPVNAITNYVIKYAVYTGASFFNLAWNTFSSSIASTARSATVTGLTNGTQYSFWVLAVNSDGTTSNDSIASVRSTPTAATSPPTVPFFYVNSVTSTSMSLVWDRPDYMGSSAITDYTIRYSANNGSTWTTFSDGVSTTTSATITGLTAGTQYLLRVAAVNAAGSSTTYDDGPYLTAGGTLAAPTNFQVVNSGNNTATLSWTDPASYSPLSSQGIFWDGTYVIQYSSNAGSTWTRLPGTFTSASPTVVTGLKANVPYRFRVAASGSYGGSVGAVVRYPAIGTYTSAAAIVIEPAAPTNVTAISSDAKATVSWTAPSNNGATITDYIIQYSTNNGTTWTTFSDGTSTGTSVVVTGLTNNTAYIFRVAAVNSVGTGPYSAASASVTPDSSTVTTTTQTVADIGGLSNIASSPTLLVATGSSIAGNPTSFSGVYTSPDGVTWTSVRLFAGDTTYYGNVNDIVWTGTGFKLIGSFVVGATSYAVINSNAAGTTWTAQAISNAEYGGQAALNGSNVLAFPDSGEGSTTVLYNNSELAFTVVGGGGTTRAWSIAYGGDKYVAVSEASGSSTNCFLRSTNGTTWYGTQAPQANWWTSIAYGNGLFVAVARTGTQQVATSTDGISWIGRAAAENNYWTDVAYQNGFFVAVANQGVNRLMASADGINWSAWSVPSTTWVRVAFSPLLNRFVAVSSNSSQVLLIRVNSLPAGNADPNPPANSGVIYINVQPQSISRYGMCDGSVGSGGAFSLSASSVNTTSPLTYQWQYGSTAAGWTDINPTTQAALASGANTDTLSVFRCQSQNQGGLGNRFRCVISAGNAETAISDECVFNYYIV